MKTVLLAYEREQDLAAVETMLQSRGHRIVKTRNGIEALEAIRAETPDVLVSDVLLPRLDGFALCRRLREDPDLMHLPVVLHSFRVAGPKYEAFAAEVGAQRFLPRGSSLDELAMALADSSPGSGTVRIPALVPELLDRREQDRMRLIDVERQVRDLEATNQQLAAGERVARERAEYEARARAEFAAAESVRIRELQVRIRDLETAQRAAAEAESRARGAVAETRAESAKLATLESQLAEVQEARARAQAAAGDVERVFVAQPVPTWVCDMDSLQLHLASDSAAALFGVEPGALRGKSVDAVLPGLAFADGAARETVLSRRREDGSESVLEVRRQAVSYGGCACWLMTAADVTANRSARASVAQLSVVSQAFDFAPEPSVLADAEGRLRHGNRAFLELLGIDAERLETLTLQQLEGEAGDDATIRSLALGRNGRARLETRWRRPNGSVIDVEIAAVPCEAMPDTRVLSVRDISPQRRTAERNEREQLRVGRLLDLTHRAHGLTETEILEQSLQIVQDLTGSPLACVFLALTEPTQLELAVRRGTGESADAATLLTRWRGVPPLNTALYESLSSQRTVVRDAVEGTGILHTAGLPASLRRQVATPILDGGRLGGVLLIAEKAGPYDDDDRRHAAFVAEAVSKLLRRRRSDAEIVSAMDHMERVMFGAIEALAQLADAQDACKTGRARRVAEYAAGIGTSLGLPGHTVRGLRVMGQMIDVGMLQIPREILWRPGTLSSSEFELVKTHAERGYEILRRVEFPWAVAETVRQHHERLDGSGYPRGLRGDEILLEARIVAVADAVEAMLAQRPHRPALSLAACIEELQSQAGRRYDARVVKACVKLLRDGQASAPDTTVQEGEAPAGMQIA